MTMAFSHTRPFHRRPMALPKGTSILAFNNIGLAHRVSRFRLGLGASRSYLHSTELRRNLKNIFRNRPQKLRNTPRLGDTATGGCAVDLRPPARKCDPACCFDMRFQTAEQPFQFCVSFRRIGVNFRPDGCVACVAGHHVVQALLFRVPEDPVEVNMDVLPHFSQKQFGAAVASSSRKFFQDSQRVLPKGLDFDGLAGSRRHDPVADLPA